jgi:hypothetical protein
MGSELSVEKYPILKELLDYDPNVWRDTVVVPPMGRARIFVQYKEYTGKTVFHCHFLGMFVATQHGGRNNTYDDENFWMTLLAIDDWGILIPWIGCLVFSSSFLLQPMRTRG